MTLRALALLLAFLLGFAQQGAQLHALAHAEHDLLLAQHEGEGVPPVGHGKDECLAFVTLDSPAPSMAAPLPSSTAPVVVPATQQATTTTRILTARLSRGPPTLLS